MEILNWWALGQGLDWKLGLLHHGPLRVRDQHLPSKPYCGASGRGEQVVVVTAAFLSGRRRWRLGGGTVDVTSMEAVVGRQITTVEDGRKVVVVEGVSTAPRHRRGLGTRILRRRTLVSAEVLRSSRIMALGGIHSKVCILQTMGSKVGAIRGNFLRWLVRISMEETSEGLIIGDRQCLGVLVLVREVLLRGV